MKNDIRFALKMIVLTAALLLPAVISACSSKTGSDLPKTMTKYDLLNTVITISIYDDTKDKVFNDAFNKISSIDQTMSAVRTDSEISAIAAMAGKSPVQVSEEAYFVIKEAYDITARSGGAFNLAISPLVKLWGINTPSPYVPNRTEIASVQKLLDYNDVILSDTDRSVYLAHEGMSIDLGAIAKGYAGDAAAEIVRDHGVRHAILDLGGNIVTIGGRPDGTDWRIGVRNPIVGESGYIGVLSIQDKAVVTSGGYERYFESDGQLYHHIFDGKTGYPAESGLLSVTIISDSSTDADKLSTVAFVLGVRAGMGFLTEYEDTDAIFITTDLEIFLTPGIKDSFVISDDRFCFAAE